MKTTKKSKKNTNLKQIPKLKSSALITLMFVFGSIGVIALVKSFAAPGGAVLLGTIQGAANQSTTVGKNIYALKSWQGKIYAGYGDYSANTGPIAINSYNPTTKLFTQEGVAQSDAIYIYRELGGKLFAPSIDNKGSDLVRQEATGQWTNITGLGSTHAFDMAELDGKIWTVGSIGKVATVWSSSDGGTTWQIALSVPAERLGYVARFYFVSPYKGKLYVQATDGAYPHSTAYSYDPATKLWSKAAAITISDRFFDWGSKPVEFAGNLLLLSREVISRPSGIIRYDGTARTSSNEYGYTVAGSYYDYTIDGEYLYVLNGDGSVKRTRNLTTWENVGTGPKQSRTTGAGRSIAVLNGKVYIGTFDSKLFELTISTTSPKPGNK